MSVDILAIAAHRDDVELTCAGTLLKAVDAGYRAGILDLTEGETATRGSADLRAQEAVARRRSWASRSGATPGSPTHTCTTARRPADSWSPRSGTSRPGS